MNGGSTIHLYKPDPLPSPLEAKTDELAEAVAGLKSRDEQLGEKDAQLLSDVSHLEAKDRELIAKAEARREQVEELLAGLENPEVIPGDGYPSPDEFGLSGHGLPLAYTDNGDRTATDNTTRFIWEVKLAEDGSDGGNCDDPFQENRSIHCANNQYSWSTDSRQLPPTGVPNGAHGTLFMEFLDTLNNKCDGDESTQCRGSQWGQR